MIGVVLKIYLFSDLCPVCIIYKKKERTVPQQSPLLNTTNLIVEENSLS
jgi:hypothetical protein